MLPLANNVKNSSVHAKPPTPAYLRPRHFPPSHDRYAGERQNHPRGNRQHQSKRRAGYHGARPLQLSSFLELGGASPRIIRVGLHSGVCSVEGGVSRAKIPFLSYSGRRHGMMKSETSRRTGGRWGDVKVHEGYTQFVGRTQGLRAHGYGAPLLAGSAKSGPLRRTSRSRVIHGNT